MTLDQKPIIVTGAGRGIGQAIVFELVRQGARVLGVARTQRQLLETREQAEKINPGHFDYNVLDVTNQSAVESFFSNLTHAPYGLICAAGVYGPIGPFEEIDISKWKETFDTNVFGSILCAKYAALKMKEHGIGRIVFFSGGGEGPLPRFSAYVSSKGAIWRLTETLGHELAPLGIMVNAVAPGAVNTKFLDDLLAAGAELAGHEQYMKARKQKHEGGASPLLAARLCVYLMSQQASGLYGKTLSAVWDDYEKLTGLETLSKSPIYTYKRVVK